MCKIPIYSNFTSLVSICCLQDALVSSLWSMCSKCNRTVFSEVDCLLFSVLVFLHSHLLFCLPVFDSRQVSASFCWLIGSFLQPYPSPLPPQTHTAIGRLTLHNLPASLYLPLALPCLFVPLSVSGM